MARKLITLDAWMFARLPGGKSIASHVLPTWYIDVTLGWILLVPFMVMLGSFVHINMLFKRRPVCSLLFR